MFIKHGDGKITGVLDEEELTDEQKKKAKDLSSQTIKTLNKSDSLEKKSGS